MKNRKEDYIYEAHRITKYLLPISVGPQESENYKSAMNHLDLTFTNYEAELWKVM